MKAARRESGADSQRLLAKHEKESSFLKTPTKRGAFSSFRKDEDLAPTPPITPDEKELDVAVMAMEYDPTAPFPMTNTKISGLTKEGTPPRKVDFPASPAAYSQPNGNSSTKTPEVLRDKGCNSSVLNQTLGLFDDICQVPENTPAVVLPRTVNEWGTVPSYEEDESTLPSTLTRSEQGHSQMTGTTPQTSVQLNSMSTPSVSAAAAAAREAPALVESPSHDHENFEVVLDATQLESAAPPTDMIELPVPEEPKEPVVEEPKPTKARKSLVKRLFRGRKKKAKAAEPVAEPEEVPVEEEEVAVASAEEESVSDPEAVSEAPEEKEPEEMPIVEREVVADEPTADDASAGAQIGVTRAPEAPATEPTLGAKDEIYNALSTFFGALDMDPKVEEEKKEEEPSIPQETTPAPIKKEEPEAQGLEDETEAKDVVEEPAAVPEPETETTPEVVAPVQVKKEKSKSIFGGFAKKLGKSFKKNKQGSPATASEAKSGLSREVAKEDTATEAKTTKSKKNKPLWKTAVDPKTGKTYWYNRETRESTYNPPPEAFAPVAATVDAAPTTTTAVEEEQAKPEEPVPSVSTPTKSKSKKNKPTWKAVVDKNSGRTYYYHRKTRETTWTMPEELKKLEETAAVETKAAEPVESLEESVEVPPMVVKAEVSEASQQRISRGEQGLLDTSMEQGQPMTRTMSAPQDEYESVKKEIERLLNVLGTDPSSGEVLMKEYDGSEDVLLQQLRAKVEARPFDEPEEEESAGAFMASPSRLSTRSTTLLSRASAATKGSTRTEKTERIKNTMKRASLFEVISETQSTATSITSGHDMATPRRGGAYSNPRIPSRVPVHRERELHVEDLTSSRVIAENFDTYGRVIRSRAMMDEEPEDASYLGDNELNSYGTDEVSALSETDQDFSHRRENFEQARRRALDDAIEREDWDLAAALSEGMKASSTTGDYTKAHTEWNQSDLDKFIANNDWQAVKSYIAHMREARKGGQAVPVVPEAPKQPEVFSKRIGSRSQLQHNQLEEQSPSWTSADSFDSEGSSETDYS